MKKYIPVLIIAMASCQQTTQSSWLESAINQPLTKTPVVFLPDLVSTSSVEYNSSLSIDAKAFYFTKATDDFRERHMMVSYFENSRFTQPKRLELGGNLYKNASDLQVSNDGSTLIFKMRGNVLNDSARRDGNIWLSNYDGQIWESPKMLPEAINSDKLNEYYPIVTNSGNLYFSREVSDDNYDIYISKFIKGEYEEAQPVSELINTELLESDAYIDPYEEFMIFVRMFASDGQGVSDLYISFNHEGQWTDPRIMTSYNSPGVDGSPFVTADGKYIFFTSTRDSPNPENFDGHLDIYIAKFDLADWR